MTIPYATLAEVKTRINKATAGDDTTLTAMILGASQAIDNLCNRADGFVALSIDAARLYSGDGGPILWIDECVSISLVEVKEDPTVTAYTPWTAADWLAFAGDPDNPIWQPTVLADPRPYEAIMVSGIGDQDHFTSGQYTTKKGFSPQHSIQRSVPTVRVTAKWGFAVACPPVVREACVLLVARWYKRGESAWSDTLATADGGQLLYRQKVDPDLALMLVEARLVRVSIG